MNYKSRVEYVSHLKYVFYLAFIVLFTLPGAAQENSPKPTPTPDETIKVVTEEVHLNVIAQTDSGKFVPSLKADDLLVVEEGDPQTITSMKRVPANVLLLLDTGSELNFVKSVGLTRLTAKLFIYNLLHDDKLSVMQYYDKIETVSDWTSDFNAAADALNKKLFSGKRARFSDALNAAVEAFKSRPLENRHLVLISDGLENVADESAQQKALQNLLAANITVHVLSYTQFEQQSAQKASQRVRWGNGHPKDRIPDEVLESILQTVPEVPGKISIRETVRSMYKSQAILIFDLDNERLKLVRRKQEAWHQSEIKLQTLAEDTGGIFQAPEKLETMWLLAGRIANAIDANYVITYVPTRPIADSPNAAPRKVRVSTPLNGVQIRARQKVVLIQSDTK